MSPTATGRLVKLKREEIDTNEALEEHLAGGSTLRNYAIQGVDIRRVGIPEGADVEGTVFIGCTFEDRRQQAALVARGAAIFPRLEGLPYDPYRTQLYTVEELMEGHAAGYTATRDFRVYAHFDKDRRDARGLSLKESLAQRVHDHAIDHALEEVLDTHSGRGVVGIMGGHGARRSDSAFLKVAQLAWRLTRAGYLVATGGGPGIMEAGNLGAFFANYADPSVLEAVIEGLSGADRFDGDEEEGTPEYLKAIGAYFACGHRVLETYGPNANPDTAERFRRERESPGASLAIPTWFYGHEPSNLFSTHIAKYFSNSLREDGLLAIATGGVVYAPGSAGTLQEVFMDLAQNHYATFKLRSPMVFLGSEAYADLFGLLERFVAKRNMQAVYGDMLHLSDDPEAIVAFIEEHPPRPREEKRPLYELV